MCDVHGPRAEICALSHPRMAGCRVSKIVFVIKNAGGPSDTGAHQGVA